MAAARAAPEDSVDAFDQAARLLIDGVRSPDTSQTYELSGRMLVSGPETMSGLAVTRRAYVPDGAGANWCCFIEYLENPTGAAIAAAVRIGGNLGSDGDTTVTGSSSGDTTWTPEDRWVTSDDGNDGAGDPSLSFNYWGTGASVTPTAVYLPASQEDYYCDFGTITVPAGETVLLMHFISQNADNATAQATAAALDALPADALAGLNAANYGPVLNWDMATELAVAPESLRAFSGQQGGPFTPASYDYTLENTSGAALDWTASGPAWVDIAPASGNLPASGTENVTVSINATANGLTPGQTLDSVTFSNTTAGEDVMRGLRVDVTERLEITETDGFAAAGFQGGPFAPVSRTYQLTNVGTSALQWSTTAPAWITVTPADHTAAGGELASLASVVITVAPNAAAEALTPGDYSDTLSIDNDSFGTVQTRTLDLSVAERLRITCSEGEPAISRGLAGGPFAPSGLIFNVLNASTDASVDWQIDAGSIPAWMTFAVSSGTSAAGGTEMAIGQFNATAQGLAAGDYTATLIFENTTYASTVPYDVILRVKDTVYVDAAAGGGGDGLSWGTAYDTIQEGIDLAATGEYWVWVAKGTYNERITLAQGVEVFGGFENGDTAFADRELIGDNTIVDGGAAGRVATFGAIGLAGIGDLTLKNGSADADGGGGVRMDGSENTCFVDRCVICENRTLHRGAGIYCLDGASPRLSYNFIFNNVQDDSDRDFGGGIACCNSSPTIYHCVIVNNVGRYGAGIGCIESSPRIECCTITGNMAAYDVINPDNGHPHGSGGGGHLRARQFEPGNRQLHHLGQRQPQLERGRALLPGRLDAHGYQLHRQPQLQLPHRRPDAVERFRRQQRVGHHPAQHAGRGHSQHRGLRGESALGRRQRRGRNYPRVLPLHGQHRW